MSGLTRVITLGGDQRCITLLIAQAGPKLEALALWDWEDDKIRSNLHLFQQDAEAFLDSLEQFG